MMTWAEFNESRQLRKERRRLAGEYKPPPNATREEERCLGAEYFAMCEPIEHRLWAIETAVLRRSADRWSIDVEAKWDPRSSANGRAFFSKEDRNALSRAISHERREFAKFLAGMVVPVLSLLVALAAVLTR